MPRTSANVAEAMDRCRTFNVEIGARIGELGRQPRTSRKFFDRYQDRILFGTDAIPEGKETPQQIFGEELYRIYYRFLETEDEYFDYAPAPVPPQGRWRIYGIGLPDGILKKVTTETRLACSESLSRRTDVHSASSPRLCSLVAQPEANFRLHKTSRSSAKDACPAHRRSFAAAAPLRGCSGATGSGSPLAGRRVATIEHVARAEDMQAHVEDRHRSCQGDLPRHSCTESLMASMT